MEWETFEKKFFRRKEHERTSEQRKIDKEVFDESTVDTIWKLANRGWLDYLGGVVSTGKEANVFKGYDRDGNVRAYKIYRIETSNFQSMWKYIEGDQRFERTKPNKRSMVMAWCRKEFKNLELARKAGCSVPEPFYHLNNVLVMQFLGKDEGAPLLKDIKLSNPENVYWAVAKDMKNLFAGGLVHADLSEFNILWWENRPWMIDIGQGVLLTHSSAEEFLARDCMNIAKYFSKLGVRTSANELEEYIKN